MPIQFDQTTAGVVTLGTSSTSSYSLTFPSSSGSSGNYLINDGSGGLSWGSPSLTGFTAAINTSSPNDVVNVSSLSASGGTTNQFIALVPSATTGSIIANIPDGTVTGGNARGTRCVDLQLSRSTATQVAGGTGSVILGGYANLAGSGFSYNAVLGGSGNKANGDYSLVMGGSSNTATSSSIIMGGSGNTSSASSSMILGGKNNSGYGTAILGGYANYGLGGGSGSIVWNQANPLNLSTTDSLIGRSWNGNSLRSSTTYTSSTLTSIVPRSNSVYFYEVNFLANVGPPNSANSPCIQRGYYLAKKGASSASWVAGTADGVMPFIINNSKHTASVSNSGTGMSVTVTNTFNNNTSAFSSVQYFFILVA